MTAVVFFLVSGVEQRHALDGNNGSHPKVVVTEAENTTLRNPNKRTAPSGLADISSTGILLHFFDYFLERRTNVLVSSSQKPRI